MKLFVGLGNPGEKYSKHRHNIGFRTVDQIAETYPFPPWKKKFKGLITEGLINETKVILLKPQTYMNESGQSVGEVARFFNLSENDIIVFHDELDLPSGKVKAKIGGGNAGHNGLRSIDAHAGNQTVRVRIGIGHPGSKEAVAHYVLSDFSKSEGPSVEHLLTLIAKCAPYLCRNDIQGFMNNVSQQLNAPIVSRKENAQQDKKTTRNNIDKSSGEEKISDQIVENKKTFFSGPLKDWFRGRKPSK